MELSRNEADSQRHYVSSLFFQARRRAAPRAQEPKGPKGPKGAFGALWGDGPMGPFGVIPKPFRMEGHFEWRVITSILAGLAQKYVKVVLGSIISKTLLGQARNALKLKWEQFGPASWFNN